MGNHLEKKYSSARVITVNRRAAVVKIEANPDCSLEPQPPFSDLLEAKLSTQIKQLCVGDRVLINTLPEPVVIESIKERDNEFFRSYRKRHKYFASNIDQVIIITALGELNNTIFIDRVLAATQAQGLSAILVINKADLGSTEQLKAVYKQLGITVLETSALLNHGLSQLKQHLSQPELKWVLLCGLSGVGKSTIVNQMVPDAKRAVNEVSRKTGQGQQTTTQTMALEYQRDENDRENLMLIDSPGLQNFGLSHFTKEVLRNSFPEISTYAINCEFRDCMHVDEENCEVQDAVERGEIAESRYASYLNILEEIEITERFKYK